MTLSARRRCDQLGPVSDRWLRDLGQGKKRPLIIDADIHEWNVWAAVSREAAIVRRKADRLPRERSAE